MKFFYVVALTVLMTALACAAAAGETRSGQSLALTIALTTGLTHPERGPIRDLKRSELPPDLANLPDNQLANSISSGVYAAMGAGTLAGFFSPATALGSLADGTFFLMMALNEPQALPHPATLPQILAWAPAKSREDAIEKIKPMMVQAYAYALPDGYTLHKREITVGGMFNKKKVAVPFVEGGPVCANVPLRCKLTVVVGKPVEFERAPPWVAHGRAGWLFKNWKPKSDSNDGSATLALYIHKSIRDDGQSGEAQPINTKLGFSQREMFKRMSGGLPEWVYIYYPPEGDKPYPVIFHRGQELLFVSPL